MNQLKHEKTALVLMVVLGLFLARSYSLYALAYHNFVESIAIEAITNLVKAIVLSMPTFIVAAWLGIRLTRFVAGFSLLYAIYLLLRAGFRAEDLELGGQIGLFLACITLSGFGARFLSGVLWHRAARAIVMVIIAWAIAPLMLAWMQSDVRIRPTFSVQRILPHSPKAVVIIILDEMSPELMPFLMPSIRQESHALHTATVQKAGKDTIYAIPSMLTPQRHDGVAVCGNTQLCGRVFFDMSRLRASQADTDIVGFFHPYCAVRGVRSCWTPVPAAVSSASLFNNMTAQLHLATGGVFPKLKEPEAGVTSARTRKLIADHALGAPFWSSGGGVLYIHQYLPHPDGTVARRGLKGEYQDKTEQSARFVYLIREKLKRNFGTDYALIVTSDHPLRTSMWCSKPAYDSADCVKDNPIDSDYVPLIISAPSNVRVTIPKTNVGLLSPL